MRDQDVRPRSRRPSLAREIAIVLAVKAIALYLIWHAFFSSPYGRHLDAGGVARSLVDAPARNHQTQETERAPGPGTR